MAVPLTWSRADPRKCLTNVLLGRAAELTAWFGQYDDQLIKMLRLVFAQSHVDPDLHDLVIERHLHRVAVLLESRGFPTVIRERFAQLRWNMKAVLVRQEMHVRNAESLQSVAAVGRLNLLASRLCSGDWGLCARGTATDIALAITELDRDIAIVEDHYLSLINLQRSISGFPTCGLVGDGSQVRLH